MTSKVFRVVLVGSLVFSVTIIIEPLKYISVKESIVKKDSLKEQISACLLDKGIELQGVNKLLDNKHNFNDTLLSRLSSILNVSNNVVIEDISNKVLQNKTVDLNSADTLISIAQSIKGGYIPAESIDKIHKLSKAQIMAS